MCPSQLVCGIAFPEGQPCLCCSLAMDAVNPQHPYLIKHLNFQGVDPVRGCDRQSQVCYSWVVGSWIEVGEIEV